jgi:tetratricopeptide (TPR) repeat protein
MVASWITTMFGNRRKVRSEFRRTVSALTDAELAGDVAAAQAAIARLGELLPALRPGDPVIDDAVPLVGRTVGRLLSHRRSALRPALAVFRALLTATPFDSGLRATLLMAVGEDLLRSARHTLDARHNSDQYLIDEAIRLGDAALTAAGPKSHFQAIVLSMLGEAYQFRFSSTGDIADLDRAIKSYQRAADLVSTTSTAPSAITREVHTLCLDGLGNCLSRKFEQTADRQDLNEAIAAYRRVLHIVAPDSLSRPGHLNKLAIALHRQYKTLDAADVLNEAITLSAEAVSTGVPDSLGFASWLNTHALFLLERFARTDDLNDLQRCITTLRNSVRAEVSASPPQAMYRSTLGVALTTLYHRTSDPAVLGEAVSVHRLAVTGTPAEHPDRAQRLTRLGDALQENFIRNRDLRELDEAIDVYRDAASGAPPNPLLLCNLGVALGEHYQATGAVIEHLNEGITLLREAVALLPEDHPDQAVALSNLDRLLELRAETDD